MILPKWQYISQGKTPQAHLENSSKAINAGCKWVQLRMKNTDKSTILKTALAFKSICNKHQTLCIINDNVEVTLKAKADGVHLGKEDMSPKDARKILGNNAIIGGTANTFEDIVYLVDQGVDYIGLGPFTFTATKKKLSPTLGLKGYAKIIRKMKKQGIEVPVYAIGGITMEDISPIIQTGISGIAVSGLITREKFKTTLVNHIHREINYVI